MIASSTIHAAVLLGLTALAATSRSADVGGDAGMIVEFVHLGAADDQAIGDSALTAAGDPAAMEAADIAPATPEPLVAALPPAAAILPTPQPSPPVAPPTAQAQAPPHPRPASNDTARATRRKRGTSGDGNGGNAPSAGAPLGNEAATAPIAAAATGSPVEAATPVVTTVQYRETPTPPTYPRRARELQISGTTILRALVDRDGRTREVRVWRSSGSDSLDEAAAVAARRWAFAPAQRDGRVIEAWVEIPVHFHLR